MKNPIDEDIESFIGWLEEPPDYQNACAFIRFKNPMSKEEMNLFIKDLKKHFDNYIEYFRVDSEINKKRNVVWLHLTNPNDTRWQADCRFDEGEKTNEQ